MAQQTKSPENRRYEDERLDPFQQESDAIFNRPDMQALNDRGDAIARDHESGLDDSNSTRADRREAAAQARRDAEQKEWDSAANTMGYNPKAEPNAKGKTGFRNLLNKKNALRGGIAGGTIGIALALFGFLTPFKIPALMQIITDETGQRVEQITTRRAKVILARAILSRFGVEGAVVTGKGPVSSLIATMRTNKFEEKVLKPALEQKGITYETNGKTVKLSRNGKDLGSFGSDSKDEEILKVLKGDPVTSKVIDAIVKDNIPTWRFFKRAKFASWLRIKYGIPRFGTKKTTETDKEKKIADVQKERFDTRYGQYADNLTEAVGCVLGEAGCPIENPNKSAFQRFNEKIRGSASSIKNSIKSSATEQVGEISDAASKSTVAKVNETLEKIYIKKFASKAIPIIGWIDLAATLDHIAYEGLENDYITTIPSYYRSISYAQMYGEWIGYADQTKNGDMDNDIQALLAGQLDGAEESQAFNYLMGNVANGVPVKIPVNENNPSLVKQQWQQFKASPGGTYYRYVSHPVLDAYYNTIGGNGLLGAISDFVGAIISKGLEIITPDALEKYLSDYLSDMMGKLFIVVGMAADPSDVGPDLFNDAYAGGDVTYNTYCKEKGCRKLTDEQVRQQRGQVGAERAQEIKDNGPLYAMFSPNVTSSFTNQLAMTLPSSNSDVTSSVGQLASLVTRTPALLSNVFNPLAKADTGYVNLNGINNYGALESDLNQPLADQAITGEDCPAVEDGVYNGCNWDKDTAEAMLCNFQPDSDACNFTSASLTGEGISFMSYNILGAGHTNTGGIGYKDRLKNVIETITDQSPEVVGFQEVNGAENAYQPTQLRDDLSSRYDGYPYDGDARARPIYWKKEAFTELDHGTYAIPRYDGTDSYPWVKLRSLTSDIVFYVFNQHNAAGDKDHARTIGGLTSPEQRKVAAQKQLETVKRINTENLPVVMVGDYNSKCEVRPSDDPLKLPDIPCSIFRSDGFEDAGEAAQQAGSAVNYEYGTTHDAAGSDFVKNENHIDHVFYSQGLKAGSWMNIINETTKNASDHSPVVAKIIFPGSNADPTVTDQEASALGYSWPVEKSKYKPLSNCYAKPGHTGIDIPVPVGTPVLAAKAGTVVQADPGGSGAGGKYLIIKHDDGHWTNYQHNSKLLVGVDDTVKAGQQISVSGNTGFSTGPHLHFSVTTQEGLDSRNSVAYSVNPIPFLPKDRSTGSCGG